MEEQKQFPTEQTLRHQSFIRFDKIDALKILFGRSLKVETIVTIPQSLPIESCNAVVNLELVSTTSHFTKSNLPPFGYESKSDSVLIDKTE